MAFYYFGRLAVNGGNGSANYCFRERAREYQEKREEALAAYREAAQISGHENGFRTFTITNYSSLREAATVMMNLYNLDGAHRVQRLFINHQSLRVKKRLEEHACTLALANGYHVLFLTNPP